MNSVSLKTVFRRVLFGPVVAILTLVWPFNSPVFAQQQQQGLCARVKIVIKQQLTLERVGFDAALEITDNDGNDPITDFFATLTFQNPALSTQASANDASSLFFVQPPKLENVSDVNGNGVIGPTLKATIHWFIIPKITAGGIDPNGVHYIVGAKLSGKLRGVDIPSDVLLAIPADIYVKPEAQLDITYFQPRDVQGDDPFTPEVESPVPFSIGVLVKNSGYGVAKSVQINSQQPKIVENKRNLLLIAQLLGARVSDQSLASPSLLLNLGDIPPGQTRKGAWDMITSLSGEFIEFKASYTHASDLGGQDTSIIKSLNACLIAHEVLNDLPGRDNLKDFLAQVVPNDNLVPDTLFESEGIVAPVNYLTNAVIPSPPGSDGAFKVNLSASQTGWGYMRLDDPAQAKLPIGSVVRSDGKILNPNNYWTNVRHAKITNIKSTYLNLFDLVQVGDYQYTVTFAPAVVNTNPPVTTLHFAGQVASVKDVYYIAPDTQMYFISDDPTPVSIFYSITNSAFLPAYPFSLGNPGQYPIQFYAINQNKVRETNHSALLVVGNTPPVLSTFSAPTAAITVSGDALSVRPSAAAFTFQLQPNPMRVDAQMDIFQGVVGWCIVAGVPPSPTRNRNASLKVGGDQVDYYRYQLDGANWSGEQVAAQAIVFTNLANGAHLLSVLGRSQYGNYLDNSNAVQVSWVVDSAAPTTTITGTPATPSRDASATLSIGGSGVDLYRWTLNNGYYRAETAVANPLVLSNLSVTQCVIAVLGRTSGIWQDTNNPTTVSWTLNPTYGSDLSALTQVRSVTWTNLSVGAQSVQWDGRNNAGIAVGPGWYTVRLTLQDQLGQSTFATRLVQIGELSGNTIALADASRGPKNPYARGHWAVWQDQSDGNWEIYAQDLNTNTPIFKVTNSTQNQENPRTDGRYLVWQARQANGNWDVFIKDLSGSALPLALTSSPDLDEVNPVIDWPWVIFQRRSSGASTAPWQLYATNLASAQGFAVWPGTQDQLDPDVQAGRVVWQDWRDVGPGEIYFKNLETGEQRRITTNTFGQYHPAIFDNWIVWQDNRGGQSDLYGLDLLRNTEVRVTSTPYNETRPYLDSSWAACLEDSLGPLTANLRLVHLPSLRSVPVTRTITLKDRAALASGKAIWLDTINNQASVMAASIPSLQAVVQNRNAIAVTDAMAAYQQNAYALLNLWNAQAGVQEITHYTSLVPQVVSETVFWNNGAPTGPNFTLSPGSFLWVKFDNQRVLDLGLNPNGPLSLAAGANVVGYAGFPSQFSAFSLLRQLGLNNARAVRMLDSQSGRWLVAEVLNGRPVGVDFNIPRVAVVMLDLVNPVNNFQPQ